MADNDTASDATADSKQERKAEIDVGDRYRVADDGTVFEVVGITDEEVDVVQYDDTGEIQSEYTTSIEDFHSEIVAISQ